MDAGYGAAISPAQFDPAWRAALTKDLEERWFKPLPDAGVTYTS